MKRVRISQGAAWVAMSTILLGATALLLLWLARVWTDWAWYSSMGHADVMATNVMSRLVVWLISSVIAGGVLWGSSRSALGLVPDHTKTHSRVVGWAAIALGAVSGFNLSASWETFGLATTPAQWGVADPLFGLDVSFFVFRLPALESLIGWATGLVGLSLLLSATVIALGNYRATGSFGAARWWRLKALGARLVGSLVLCASANYVIGMWRLDLSSRTQLVGASYTDVHAQLPGMATVAVLGAALGIAMIATARSRSWRGLSLLGTAWVLSAIAFGTVLPAFVQRYAVAPNEFAAERPYIERNIAMTRQAFGLDSVVTTTYPQSPTIAPGRRSEAASALAEARIWTASSTKPAYDQLETIRPYYRLSTVHTDRYRVGDSVQQVLVSARLIDAGRLPKRARTWVNQHLVYTHGYGLVIGSATQTDPQGFPRILVGDVPASMHGDAVGSPALSVDEPRTYYGPGMDDYAIVNTGIDEFDYPSGDSNRTYRNTDSSGVRVGSPLQRLAWSIRLGSDQILFSEYLTDDSRILLNRDVVDRASTIAPWLTFDDDPYAAIVDGRIVWIVDGYTSSDHYPYAQRLDDGTNYLRDSVKAVVDAGSGQTTLYAMGEDPVRDAWSRIYPTVITPQDKMSRSLAEHLEFPVRMFSAQEDVLRTYHMTDAKVFYGKEDQWQVSQDGPDTKSAPSYLMLQSSADVTTHFELMQPYSPVGRDNVVAWMTVSSDPDDYGTHVVHIMPKDRVVLGPDQVKARIEQDPEISPQLTLWDQRGSKVVLGDMALVPTAGSLAYVQPIFIQAGDSPITELAGVVLVTDEKVRLGKTLPEAIDLVVGKTADKTDTGAADDDAHGDIAATVDELLGRIASAKAAGDFTTYAALLEQLRAALDALLDGGSQ